MKKRMKSISGKCFHVNAEGAKPIDWQSQIASDKLKNASYNPLFAFFLTMSDVFYNYLTGYMSYVKPSYSKMPK